jgi:glycosyltransferase involved in cell wall biosynthesis
MKSALFITSAFPPEENGGTIRISKLAKYLPQTDWQLTILTARPPRSLSVMHDELFENTIVYRAPRCDITGPIARSVAFTKRCIFIGTQWVKKYVTYINKKNKQLSLKDTENINIRATPKRRLAEYILIPDDRALWIPSAAILGLWSIYRKKPLIIYSTSPSPSTLIVGYILKIASNLPWVVEFRDPWINNPFRIPRPFKLMELLDGWLERKILQNATHIVVTSSQYKLDILHSYPMLNNDSISYIPNGFDPEDFDGVNAKKFKQFTIVHAGNFYGARSAKYFLLAVHTAINDHPSIMRNLKVLFIGQRDVEAAKSILDLGLENIVEQIGIVSHVQSIEYMKGADVLLLVPGPGAGTMPGKTFEYLAARKPILALTGEGVVKDLVLSTNTGKVVSPENTNEIADCLVELFSLVNSPNGFHYPNEFCIKQILKQYDRKEIAIRVALLMDSLVAI